MKELRAVQKRPVDEAHEPDHSRSRAEHDFTLQSLIDCVPDYLWVKDVDGRFTVVNKAITADAGRSTSDEMLGLDDFDLHDAELASRFMAIEQRIIETGEPVIDLEEQIVDGSGARKWFSTTKVPLRNTKGDIFALIGIGRDITHRKIAEALRTQEAQILEMIATGAPLDTVVDQIRQVIECHARAMTAAIFTVEQPGRKLVRTGGDISADALDRVVQDVSGRPHHNPACDAVITGESVIVADILVGPIDDDVRLEMMRHGFRSCWALPICSHLGGVLGVIAVCGAAPRVPSAAEAALLQMMTRLAAIAMDRKRAEDHIRFMAMHDTLTALPNRSILNDRVDRAILDARRGDRGVSIVFIDLDGFKLINDRLGHRTGDELLKRMARQIEAAVQPTDTVIRWGGDEFVLVLAGRERSDETLVTFLQSIRAAICEPCRIDTHHIRMTASLGVARYPEDGTDADTLLANADAAMYRAKDSGRDHVEFFTPDGRAQNPG